MRRAPLAVSLMMLLGALACAEDVKQPDAPECKGFLKSGRARLTGLWGSYAWKEANPVRTVTFTPDNRSVLITTDAGLVFRERASGKQELALSWKGARVLSPDGKKILVGTPSEVALMDLVASKKAWSVEGGARGVAFSADGKRALSWTGSELELLDAEKGKSLRTSHLDATVELAAISPDGKRAASSEGKKLLVHDLLHPKRPRVLEHETAVTALAWEESLLVTASEKGIVRAWDPEKTKPVWEHSLGKAVVALSLGPRSVIASCEDVVTVLDQNGAVVRTFEEKDARAVALSPDGQLAATAGKVVRLWNLATGKAVSVPDWGHEGSIVALAVSGDQLHVLTGSTDRTARLWTRETGRTFRVQEGHDGPVTAVAFSPDDKLALTGSEDKTLKLWDLATGLAQKQLPDAGPVGAVGFLGKTALSVATDGTLRVHDLASGKKTAQLGTAAGHAPVAIQGKLALVANEKGACRLWDLEAQRELRLLDGRSALRAIAFSKDGKKALVGGEKTLRLWDTQSPAELHQMAIADAVVTAVAISADAKTGLSATEDGKVQLWDLDTGHLQDTIDLATSSDRALSAAFTKDGFLLGTARGVVLAFEWLGA
ncbi:MAG TPA: WD40 repeat domain-containing protein [Planctomycetota bacterium]|nr:WD40 repeat domain-containing protein [Planctomycetota bacterium]